MDTEPTERFTSRVENYVRYRPDYPAEVISLLQEQIGLAPDWVIADIGSGTGILTRRFLDAGNRVYGVEPNAAMREAGEQYLNGEEGFVSIDGTAEATTLADSSVDLVTAGQAFHWFEPARSREEFQRILRGAGWVALIWNRRPDGVSSVLDAHGEMLRKYSREYDQVGMKDSVTGEGMKVLFGGEPRLFTLPNAQMLDYDAYWGRLLSSSYTPLPGEPGHDEIRRGSKEIFDTYAEGGLLRFPYETQIFLGTVLGEM